MLGRDTTDRAGPGFLALEAEPEERSYGDDEEEEEEEGEEGEEEEEEEEDEEEEEE